MTVKDFFFFALSDIGFEI